MSLNADHYTVTLLSGPMSFSEDGCASAKIRVSIRNRDRTLMAIKSLRDLDPHRFWICDKTETSDDSLTLHYSKPAGEVVSMRHLIPRWRAEPALYIGRALDTARQLLHIAGDLENLKPFDFHISPAQMFSVRDPGGKERWMALPLPADGSAIADILRADEESWRWLSVEALFSTVNKDRSYMIAAMLYLCLVEDLFPAELHRAERIRRTISGWVGNRVTAQNVLQNALPYDLSKTALDLSEFVMSLLTPRVGRRMLPADVSRRLDLFAEELSPERLASCWEKQNNISLSRKILEDFASSAPPYEVPWDTLRRLCEKDGDQEAAAEIDMMIPGMISLPARLQKLIEGGDDTKDALKTLVATAKNEIAPGNRKDPGAEGSSENDPLKEEEYLYLAYVNGRYLSEYDESIEWLGRDFYISWSNVVRCVLTSRLLAGKSKWLAITNNCRTGRQLITQMPNSGGDRGTYAMAYLELLDGIAHFCEVIENGASEEFLNDASRHFQNGWICQQKVEAGDLNGSLVFWLQQLNARAGQSAGLETLRLGIDAFLQVLGVSTKVKPNEGHREIPWFDESRIFILNG